VFGQRLDETVLYERRYGVRLVPLVVEQCVTFIRERGLHEVGLFRQPGRTSLVKELQEAFDSGERPSFDSGTDVHTVASLLKLYLRQLPEPLVPYSHYQDFLLCGQKLLSDRTVGLEELTNLLHELPVANFNLLNFICRFLNEVQSCSSSNKMNVQNLATVFGPNILRAKAEDPQSIMGQEDSTPSVYDNLDRASLSHTLENVPTENFDLDSLGINVGMCETEVDQAELGMAGDSSSSWSSCEVLPLDKSKDELGVSSPDIPPKRSRMLPLNQRREQEICDKDDHEDNGVEGNGAKQHPSSWASCSVISISPLSTGSSEVFLPSGAPDLQVQESHLESRDTHSLLAKLRQQMAQQKAEYQNRIELERCNGALERQVAVLRLSLEQQRRSQSVAEIKIRNMERAKADADRRNTTLQREMELFFR
uniref:Rho GTPase-activating protein 22-like n=1 Tax=Poecilia latipinna TaxID=48699 RepID=A0A3B3V2C9_9TELE